MTTQVVLEFSDDEDADKFQYATAVTGTVAFKWYNVPMTIRNIFGPYKQVPARVVHHAVISD